MSWPSFGVKPESDESSLPGPGNDMSGLDLDGPGLGFVVVPVLCAGAPDSLLIKPSPSSAP